jgi:hypothetical protein
VNLHPLIANGGQVLVIGSKNTAWEPYRENAQLRFWSGDTVEIQRELRAFNNRLPDNVRAIILSRFLSHTTKRVILADAKKRRLSIFDNKGDGEITKILDEILHPEPPVNSRPAPEISVPPPAPPQKFGRGELIKFVTENIQPGGTIAQEADRLLKLAAERRFQTTRNSIAYRVAVTRRALGLSTQVPKVAPPASERVKGGAALSAKLSAARPSKVTEALSLLDETITNLGLVRLVLQEMEDYTEEYRKLLNKISELVQKT